ncbi:MAG TPA: ABC transporter permease [Xanthomonadaceae bacterium]|nr:ABC transporter permease [Xanthomonadaceae bacterium]
MSAARIDEAGDRSGPGLRGLVELVLFKTFADLRAERERTYLGFVWWFVEPLLFMCVLVVLVEVIGLRGGPGFAQFLLAGLVFWQWYKSSISHGMSSIMQAGGLLRNVRVAPAVFPLVTVFSDTIKFALVLVVLLAVLWALGETPSASYAMLPVVLVSLLLLICGIALLLAAVVPFLPDLRFVIEPVLQAQFFVSGIFYSFDRVPPEYQKWLVLNPMIVYIEAARDIVLEHRMPALGPLLAWSAIGILLLATGIALTHMLASRYSKLPA